jgi:hypothetical protein
MIIPAMAPVEIPGCWTEGVGVEVEAADWGSGVGIGVGVGSDVEPEVGKESPRRREVMYVPVEPVTVRVM